MVVGLSFSAGCASGVRHVIVVEQSAHEIEFVGFSPSEVDQIKFVLDKLRELDTTNKLGIPDDIYQAHSRFEALFGFTFNGGQLLRWLLSRIQAIRLGRSWTVAVNKGRGVIVLDSRFFKLSILEKMYLLVHEARHSDQDAPRHVPCPDDYPFISAAQPSIDLRGTRGCDESLDGAYGYQAAFLFELYAYGLIAGERAGLLFNSSLTRVLGKQSR